MIKYYATILYDGNVQALPEDEALNCATSEDFFVLRVNYTTQEAHWIDCAGHEHDLDDVQ